MNITINNKKIVGNADTPLDKILMAHYTQPLQGVAVAVNGTVIPKANWTTTIVQENDNILVITATAGG